MTDYATDTDPDSGTYGYDISDRFSHSYLGGYGSTEFLRFGADFQELDERTIACERFDPSEHLGSALLQSYAAFANAQVYRRFGDEGNFAVVWRVNRRLLSAMTQLPDGELGAERLKAALTEILSKE